MLPVACVTYEGSARKLVDVVKSIRRCRPPRSYTKPESALLCPCRNSLSGLQSFTNVLLMQCSTVSQSESLIDRSCFSLDSSRRSLGMAIETQLGGEQWDLPWPCNYLCKHIKYARVVDESDPEHRPSTSTFGVGCSLSVIVIYGNQRPHQD